MSTSPGLVVDACVAAKWHLRDEEFVAEASAVLEAYVAGRTRLTAPAFIRYEMAHLLERARRDGRIPEEGASAELRTFMAYGIHAGTDSAALVMSAQSIASAIGSSVYDALYLAQAESLSFHVVTSDEELVRLAGGYSIQVDHLADVASLL